MYYNIIIIILHDNIIIYCSIHRRRACIRSDKHRKGRLIGIDNGQLTSNEKMGLINRGRGSCIMHRRDYIHCSVRLNA